MTIARRLVGMVCGVAVLSCILACGAVKQAQQAAQDTMNLQALVQSYRAFAADPKNKGKGPANADEWSKWAQATGQSDTVALIQDCKPGGKYTFVWEVNPNKLGGQASNLVLAWDNKLPGAMGVVMMADGMTAKAVQPAEFAGLKKAPKDDGAGDEKDKDKK